MKRMAVVDFDKTLIREDSFAWMMKQEKWYLSPGIAAAGCRLAAAMALHRDTLASRSRFKEKLLEKYAALPESRKESYVKHFRETFNWELVDRLNRTGYDRMVIASASETGLIRQVLDGVLKTDDIIANVIHEETDHQEKRSLGFEAEKQSSETANFAEKMKNTFVTCWGAEKARQFAAAEPDYQSFEVDAYSDSLSDQPLFDLAAHAYLVREDGTIETVK